MTIVNFQSNVQFSKTNQQNFSQFIHKIKTYGIMGGMPLLPKTLNVEIIYWTSPKDLQSIEKISLYLTNQNKRNNCNLIKKYEINDADF